MINDFFSRLNILVYFCFMCVGVCIVCYVSSLCGGKIRLYNTDITVYVIRLINWLSSIEYIDTKFIRL